MNTLKKCIVIIGIGLSLFMLMGFDNEVKCSSRPCEPYYGNGHHCHKHHHRHRPYYPKRHCRPPCYGEPHYPAPCPVVVPSNDNAPYYVH